MAALSFNLRLALVFVLACLCSLTAHAQTLALTFDDGVNPDTEPLAREWNGTLLSGLRAASIPSMIFPALSATGPGAGRDLVAAWSAAGHAVGNHTARHRNLASPKLTLAEFVQDVEEADQAFNTLPTWVPMLRFPYLKEGDTPAKRDGMRAWMKDHGYRPAPVSIDTSDWYFNEVWLDQLAAGKRSQLEPLQKAYIRHLLDRAGYYDRLARRTLHRSPAHVMLLHVNAINAASIGVIAREFKARGWTFVSPAQAFADPLYATVPTTLPAGESIVWALAKQSGVKNLRYPAEDSVYEEPGLRAQHLLP